jgi:hypothetical protein
MDSTITHILHGIGQARHSYETAAKAWNRRSLTYYMGWDKHDAVVRRLRKHGFDDHSLPRWDGTSTIWL